ncbi:MAG TPA: serine/threonine-protein kinase [Kofleriaceae bacterium]
MAGDQAVPRDHPREIITTGDAPEPGLGRIGPYRLLGKLGDGETSSVYLAARDDDQYRQRVAIKLIRRGLDSRTLQRFHQERQILASLTHPNIAGLLDGGSTPAGQPYFVMEYVDGEPLDAHCEHAGLSVTRRLALFGVVCQAVHFAHRNLIVHRDLKPGNILVDGEGTPKLVDFGIARLLDPERGLSAEPTTIAAPLMTPHYASPEQVQGKPVSTATDVYSLGVILYKLLTGRLPYELGSRSLHDIERVVCEVTPPPPSQVLGGRRRGHLARDLDNIVLMAMRKEPERRYGSAQELADDVRRCLAHRPVIARRDTLGYRASSFVRRNAGAVAAAAVICATLFGGAVATRWQWRRAVAERTRAEIQRAAAEQTLDFVVKLFKVPASGEAHEVTARELLDRGAAELGAESQPPYIRAALKHTLGVVYRNLGSYPQAAQLLGEAVQDRERIPGGELDLADSLYELSTIDSDIGKADLGVARLRRALAIRTRLLGPDDPAVADVLEVLASHVGYNIPVPEAEDDNRRALDIRRRHSAAGDLRLVGSIAGLADLYSLTARYDESDALFREALALRGRSPDDAHCEPGDEVLLSELATLRWREGYYAEAERINDGAIACAQKTLGPDHPTVWDLMIIRIRAWCEQGRDADAEALARESLLRRTAAHTDRSPVVDNAQFHLAHVLYERGQLVEAEALERAALTRREHAWTRMHDSVAASAKALGDIQLASGDARAAEADYREALEIWPRVMGADHPYVAEAMRGLADALRAQHRLVEARPLVERALELQRRRLRPQHPAIAATLVLRGALADAPAAAEPSFREALAIWQAALGRDHPYTARAESLLGECLLRRGEPADALPLLRHGVEVLRARLGDDHEETRSARRRLEVAEPPTL